MGVISPIATDANGNPVDTGSMQTLGKDDFLKLLVAKLTNQDPLDPIEDEAFVADLAQFSTLEQMQNINNSLQNSLDWDYLQMQTINNTMATSLIGKKVHASFNNIYLDEDNTPQISFNTTEYAESVNIRIMSSDGTVVRTLTMEEAPAGTNSIPWDGRDESGQRVPQGYYTIEVSAVDASGESFTPSTFVEGKVTGVVYRDGSAYLHINGLEIPLADVTSIYDADYETEG